MLVLSRRPNQTITFPTLGISVQILRVAGQAVRLGVEAPQSVPIIRGELESRSPKPEQTEAVATERSALDRMSHNLRGQLNTATMALFVAQKQLQSGMATEANSTMHDALSTLERLEKELATEVAKCRAVRRSKHIKTLLVEDNAYEQSLLASYLRLSGMDVDYVGDGLDALDYLSKHPHPDVVLLDMRLPRFDGPATISAIRSNPAFSELKIFAVSGSTPAEYNVPTGRGGVDGWFTKPLNPAQIVETLMQTVI